MAVLKQTQKYIIFFLINLVFCLNITMPAQAAVRLKDIAHIQGVRGNQLIGYGLIVGLNGTGDGNSAGFTFQSIVSMLEKLGITVSKNDISVKNVAAVIVTAELPPFVRTGSRIDCTVSSLGNCTDLQGGTLLMTPLSGADKKVYAVAQGPVSIGGFNAGGKGKASVQKNHPTVGRIPQGALIEREVPMNFVRNNTLEVTLKSADFTTCSRLVDAVNQEFDGHIALANDGGSLSVQIPQDYLENVISLIARLEKIEVVPDMVAKVVINERTGTIVAGENVRISTIVVAHGNLNIEIKPASSVSQAKPFAQGGVTVITEQAQAEVSEDKAPLVLMSEGINIGEVANALNELGVTPRDMIAIFQAIKQAGALQADLVII
ncbi:MAG: flagellar biosynthesis protein FlgA [Candidatus Omnitrophota bacterium]|nr:MAG: flagellar biosynthesis protein FlgA [Candidatus Omnitrophota bacterium]